MQRPDRNGVLGKFGQANDWTRPQHLHDRLAKRIRHTQAQRFTDKRQPTAQNYDRRIQQVHNVGKPESQFTANITK